MRILVITSCTGQKAVSSESHLTIDDFRLGADHVEARERELADLLTPAEDLYTGQQHKRLMQGVRRFRAATQGGSSLDLRIVSAGYGLVPGDRLQAPYECGFNDFSTAAAREWSEQLGIPQAFRDALRAPYDLGVVILGEAYLRSVRVDRGIELGGPTLFVVGQGNVPDIARIPEGRALGLAIEDTRRFGCGLVGLKGEVAGRLLGLLAETRAVEPVLNGEPDLLSLLAAAPPTTARVAKPVRVFKANPNVDRVIELPPSWRDRSDGSRLRYFVPDWDDRVDPDYDFENDAHAGDVADWSNEVYAHQLYEGPISDGILVSRATVDEGPRKREMVYRLGVHRFLRVPAEFPLLGDCGAFSYVREAVPPYTTGDVLDYYTDLGFDLGISVDHLVFAQTEEERRARYDLTIHNADEFRREHRARGLGWEPVGAVQGWDPKSYADAARRYVAMGYGHVAIGGLVRSSDKDILRVMEAVHPVVPPTVKIHLLGIARFRALRRLVDLGVTSIDSASPLRRAWLGSGANYLTPEGWYAAIRVPQASGNFRAKRLVRDGKADAAEFERLEKACLQGLRAFAAQRGHATVGLLDLLVSYEDVLASSSRPSREQIRRTLDERPWERCGCSICERWGIEVLIFRGNNRNRRRGFHNIHVFYDLLPRLLRGERIDWLGKVHGVDSSTTQLQLAGV